MKGWVVNGTDSLWCAGHGTTGACEALLWPLVCPSECHGARKAVNPTCNRDADTCMLFFRGCS